MIESYPDAATLAHAAAERFVGIVQDAVRERGRCAVALCGGSTPRLTYETLALPAYSSRIDWQHLHLFWSDERCVPPDHVESNYRMAEGSLLQRVTIMPENVHRLRGELPPHEAAADYEEQFRAFFGAHPPQFDCILLGLGADGHTASLFPGTAALHETSRWVTANFVPHLDAWRLTVTLPLINQAHAILFLVEGQAKAEAVCATLAGPRDCTHYPAQCIQPSDGEVCWMLDAGSASALPPSAGW